MNYEPIIIFDMYVLSYLSFYVFYFRSSKWDYTFTGIATASGTYTFTEDVCGGHAYLNGTEPLQTVRNLIFVSIFSHYIQFDVYQYAEETLYTNFIQSFYDNYYEQ